MKKFLYYWLPVVAYACLIFYISSLPAIPEPILKVTKETLILHMIEYAILSILLFRALVNSKNPILRNNAILLSILISTFYGVTDEFHQFFVSGRVANQFDVLANGLGSLVVLIRNNFFLNFRQKIKKIILRKHFK